MKNRSLLCGGVWPFILTPLILAVLTMYFMWHKIEQNIASNVQQALTKHPWARVENFNLGRDVLILGEAPSAEEAALATNLATNAEGVFSVNYLGQIKTVRPAELTLDFNNGKVLVSGLLDHPSTVKQIETMVAAIYGREKVVSKLSSAADVEKLGSPEKLIAASVGLSDGASLSIKGQQLSLRGAVINQALVDKISGNLQHAFNGNIENELKVSGECLDLLNQLLGTVNIKFETGNAAIEESSFALLQEIANTAALCPDKNFEVSGHTDSVGKLESNMALSEARAIAVVEHIVGLGLNKKRFLSRGYGPTQPIADNRTDQGRAANRRIEFRINK